MIKVKVNITDKQKKVKLPDGTRSLIRKACTSALKFENFKYDAEIDITVTDDNGIKELNSQFRGIDKSTDVLSFPLGENGVFDVNPVTKAYMLGDVVISIEHAVSQSDLYGHSLQREIAFLTVHSVLHLLGYDHVNSKDEEKIMFEKQEKILENMGLSVNKEN